MCPTLPQPRPTLPHFECVTKSVLIYDLNTLPFLTGRDLFTSGCAKITPANSILTLQYRFLPTPSDIRRIAPITIYPHFECLHHVHGSGHVHAWHFCQVLAVMHLHVRVACIMRLMHITVISHHAYAWHDALMLMPGPLFHQCY